VVEPATEHGTRAGRPGVAPKIGNARHQCIAVTRGTSAVADALAAAQSMLWPHTLHDHSCLPIAAAKVGVVLCSTAGERADENSTPTRNPLKAHAHGDPNIDTNSTPTRFCSEHAYKRTETLDQTPRSNSSSPAPRCLGRSASPFCPCSILIPSTSLEIRQPLLHQRYENTCPSFFEISTRSK
jgi:hypothetical protein